MRVYSLYWGNIDPRILVAQKSIFDLFGIDLIQDRSDGEPHAAWMQRITDSLTSDDIICFCDIDAIPLSRKAFDFAHEFASNGGLFGLGQTANHLSDPDFIYAGPMFMAVKKSVWLDIGMPSFSPTSYTDAAGEITYSSRAHGIQVNLKMPTVCLAPKWPLADKGVFGIGTFYEGDFFHLFESRRDRYIELFEAVCSDVISGHNLRFDEYLRLLRKRKNDKFSFKSLFGGKN